MKVYIGFDRNEPEAARVAEASLCRRASIPVDVTRLDSERLSSHGLLRRPVDGRGGLYDLHSRAPQSTEFAVSRFLVPVLAQEGWALFVDGDVVFLDDISVLVQHADDSKALHVVKHRYAPTPGLKMDGRAQTTYPRKNWSSVCLWNVNHPANRRLTIDDVNHRPGRDLHAFYWLNDSEIGELPPRWNWLVGEQVAPEEPAIAHFTRGGPFIPGWAGAPYDEIWKREAA